MTVKVLSTSTVILVVPPTAVITPHPQFVVVLSVNLIDLPISVAKNPDPPLIPAVEDAVTVIPNPVAAEAVKVVEEVFLESHGPSCHGTYTNDHVVCPLRSNL